jgi:magnesium transporter
MKELMERKLVTVEVDEDRVEVAKRVAQLDLLAIPVVDHEHHMLGIITHDDVIDVVQDEAAEDVQRLAAVEPLHDSYLRVNLWTLSWKRGLWLTILFFGGILTAVALKNYDRQLSTWAWLIPFIPLVISSGGNSGSQSAALVISGLTRGDIRRADWNRVAIREICLGATLGIGFGIGGLLVASAFPDSTAAGNMLVVPITLFLVVVVGTFVGAMLPLMFHRLGFDPALMSNPFVTGIVDILGIVIYMNVAFWLLR